MVVYSFCQCCREPLDENRMLTVDSSTSDVFCSEECITDFYDPEIAFFGSMEDQFRQVLGINDEEITLEDELKVKVFNKTLTQYDEKIELSSSHGKKYFFVYKKFDEPPLSFYQGIICSYCEDKPSFVYNHFLTQSKKMINNYLKSISNNEVSESSIKEIEIPGNMLEETQLKKSQYLANLLMIHDDNEFPIEEFELYADNAIKTIEDADEIFQRVDEEGDTIQTYIKTFSGKSQSFFYVSINMLVRDDSIAAGSDILIPILSFPSRDEKVYRQYAQGKKIKEILKS